MKLTNEKMNLQNAMSLATNKGNHYDLEKHVSTNDYSTNHTSMAADKFMN